MLNVGFVYLAGNGREDTPRQCGCVALLSHRKCTHPLSYCRHRKDSLSKIVVHSRISHEHSPVAACGGFGKKTEVERMPCGEWQPDVRTDGVTLYHDQARQQFPPATSFEGREYIRHVLLGLLAPGSSVIMIQSSTIQCSLRYEWVGKVKLA